MVGGKSKKACSDETAYKGNNGERWDIPGGERWDIPGGER
jgi:hypothetical protein